MFTLARRKVGLCALVLWCAAVLCGGEVLAAERKKPEVGQSGFVRLRESVDMTLGRHHSLKSIQENRIAIEHERNKAYAGYGPRVDLLGKAGFNYLSNPTTRSLGTDDRMYAATSFQATLIQPLWDGWATRSRVRATQATLDSMSSRVYDNATTLALDAIIAHIDVLRMRKILSLADLNVERHRELLASSQDRASMGADTEADVSQAQGRLARALSYQEDARTKLFHAENTYRRLTGIKAPENLEEVSLPTPMFNSAQEVLDAVERYNPKLEAYKFDILAARGEKELAESEFYPQFSIEAGPAWTNRAGDGDQWTESFEVMGVVRWNIFKSFADVEATRAASARERQARQTMYDLMDTLMKDVKDTWDDYMNAQQQQIHYSNAVGYNIRTRDAYLEQFFLGNRTLLDVLDSESELYNSSTQLATAEGNILVGAYKLYGISGELLDNLGVEKSPLLVQPAADDPAPVMNFQ